jgi:hypothetical protein
LAQKASPASAGKREVEVAKQRRTGVTDARLLNRDVEG